MSSHILKTAEDGLTTLREKLIAIGAKVIVHARYVTLQMAEVAVPRELVAQILGKIDRLRLVPHTGIAIVGGEHPNGVAVRPMRPNRSRGERLREEGKHYPDLIDGRKAST